MDTFKNCLREEIPASVLIKDALVKRNKNVYFPFSGFLTSKGELVRAILYPKPVDFRFNKDTYFFIGVLGLIAAVGLVYTVVLKVIVV